MLKSKAGMISNRLLLSHMECRKSFIAQLFSIIESNLFHSSLLSIVSEPRLDFPPPFSRKFSFSCNEELKYVLWIDWSISHKLQIKVKFKSCLENKFSFIGLGGIFTASLTVYMIGTNYYFTMSDQNVAHQRPRFLSQPEHLVLLRHQSLPQY